MALPIPDADSETLSAYLDNQLLPSERATLEARLAQEPALRQTLHELRVTVEVLHELEPMRPPRSFVLDPAVVRPHRSFWQLPTTWMRLGSALAALLLAITVTLDLGARGGSNAGMVTTSANSTGSAAATAAPATGGGPMAAAATSAPAAEAAPMIAAAEATAAPAAGGMAATTLAGAASTAAEGQPAPMFGTAAPDAHLSSAAAAPTAESGPEMSAAEAPADQAADATANQAADATSGDAQLPQRSGSTSPDTTGLGKYAAGEPQIVSSQPNAILVVEFALGALALLLLAGSFWVARRR